MKIRYHGKIENELKLAISVLGKYYPLEESPDFNTVFCYSTKPGLQITKAEAVFKVSFSDLRHALRGILKLLSISESDNLDYYEHNQLASFHLMYDCSRNAVLNLESLKELLIKSALLGYNEVSLYLEDLYEIKEYPAFGYLRGKYSQSELKEINDFGKKLGIEVMASIQTLGHLAQIFHYRYFDQVKDTASNLLVDEEETYILIEAMIKTISECFDSRKIMLGMDEVHSLGRGKFLEKYGYQEQSEIFLRHLNKVTEIAKKYNYSNPIVWSDMFIKMFSKSHNYYDPEVLIPKTFIDKIPEVTLGYWDYDSTDQELIKKMIEIHQSLKRPLYLVTGLQTYFTPSYRHWQSKQVLDSFYEVCLDQKISHLLLTVWNDDGSYCDPQTSQLGIFYLSEKFYANSIDKEKFRALTGLDYELIETICLLDYKGYHVKEAKSYQSFATVFYDDPFYGVGYNNEIRKSAASAENSLNHYQRLVDVFAGFPNNKIYREFQVLAKICYLKLRSRSALIQGYFQKDLDLMKLVIADYQKIINLLKEYDQLFVSMWDKYYKTYGIEVMIGRFAAQSRRYEYLINYLEKFISQEISTIPELEEVLTPLKPIRIKDLYGNLAHTTVVR